MLGNIVLILIGFILLITGADVLVDGASGIAKKFHLPEIIIGLTIVSIGTSLPELFVSTTSALEGHSDMAIGNVIGSNICNLLLILGLSAILKPVQFEEETIKYEIPFCFAVTVLFMSFCNTKNSISKVESIILLAILVLFIIYTIAMARKEQKHEIEIEAKANKEKVKSDNKKNSTLKNIIYIILGIIALKFGGDFTVNNAVEVARHFNLSEKIISITILAIGTSLPELVTSVTAAIKGNSDIAIGNIIGSNLFKFLLIIGVTSFIQPITFNPIYNIDLSILLVATTLLALFPHIPPKKQMSRINGMIYFAMYFGYMAILFNV